MSPAHPVSVHQTHPEATPAHFPVLPDAGFRQARHLLRPIHTLSADNLPQKNGHPVAAPTKPGLSPDSEPYKYPKYQTHTAGGFSGWMYNQSGQFLLTLS